MENETKKFVNNKFSFKKLSADKKAELLDLQSGERENVFVFTKKPSVIYWILIAGALIWFVNLFFSSRNMIWESWMLWLNAAISLIAAVVLFFSLSKVLTILSKKRDGYIFTQDEFFNIKDDCVQVTNLKAIEAVQLKEDIGILEVWQGTHEDHIKYGDFADASKLERLFDEWKPEAKNNFTANIDEKKCEYNPAGKFGFIGGLLIVSILLAAGLTYAAHLSNRQYDDEDRWGVAQRGGTIGDFEQYLKIHPTGSHSKEAEEKISASLGKIKSNYEATPKKNSNPEAVAAMNAVLNDIIEHRRRTLYVKVTEKRNLDPEVITQMESEYGYNIEEYAYSAPATNEKFRREKVLNDIKVLLRNIIKDGAVNIELVDEIPAESPSIEVKYDINSIKYFYRFRFASGTGITVHYYPGLEVVFDFSLKSGDAKTQFGITHSELPGNINAGIFRNDDAENYSFDKVLFGKISENFANHLEQQLGLEEIEVSRLAVKRIE